MDGKYKISNPEGIYFITFSVVGWIDVFTRDRYREIFTNSLNYCTEKKGLILYGWVLMSNHVHFMCKAEKGNLSDILRDLKRHTSKTILKSIEEEIESRSKWMLYLFKEAGAKNSNNKEFQFWQQDNHPIQLSSNEMIDQRLDYIHNNPVTNGIVSEAQHYVYSSAIDYYGEKGMVEIVRIE
ncbi:MAG: transposase [Bacteroidetes bacterium]|nr:transposase [Bacteroidota bacterium]